MSYDINLGILLSIETCLLELIAKFALQDHPWKRNWNSNKNTEGFQLRKDKRSPQ